MKNFSGGNRSVRYLIALALAISTLAATPAQAVAATFNCPGGGTYSVNNGILLDMYAGGCVGDVVLDTSVTQINYGTSVPASVTSIAIPSTTLQIGRQPFTSGFGITAINVDAANPNYKSVDGILYNKSGTTLIQYPQAKTGSSFTIPAGVTEIGEYALSCAANLNLVTIPDGVTTALFIDRLNGCNENGISDFIVGSGNPNYSSIDGVLFNKTATTLLAYPFNKPGTSYVMPSSVTSINERAMGYSKNRQLQSITLSPNLTSIGTYSFTGLNLGTLNLPASVTTIQELGLHGVQAVTLSAGSAHLSLEDGVLYNLNKTRLIYYPNGKNSPSFTIPTTVTQVNRYAFYASSQDLIRLTIGGSLTTIGSDLEIRNLKYLIITGDTSADFSSASFPALQVVSYCGTNPTNLNNINSKLAAWNNATLSCVAQAPAFTLSQSAETVASGNVIDGYAINSTVAAASYSISPSAGTYGLTFNTSTGLLTGTWNASSSTTVDFSVTGSNALGDTTVTYSVSTSRLVTCGEGTYTITNGIASDGTTCTGELVLEPEVTEIAREAFQGSLITSLTLPEGITTIRYQAFEGARGYSTLIIPNSVTVIEDKAFEQGQFTNLVIGDGITSIGRQVFYRNYGIRINSVIFGAGVTSIGLAAFQNLGVPVLVIPEGVTTLESRAFDQNSADIIILPDSLTSVAPDAFDGGNYSIVKYCGSNASVTSYAFNVPITCSAIVAFLDINSPQFYFQTSSTDDALDSNPFTLDGYIFSGWNTEPDGTGTAYEDGAIFQFSTANDTELFAQWILIPYDSSAGNGNVACSIYGHAVIANFEVTANSSCEGTITIPSGVTSIGYGAFEGSDITDISIPNTVTSIGAAAFRAATSLTTVTFETGSTLTSIGSAAFERTAIASISLPATLRSLGNYAFWSNSALTSIVIPEGVTSLYQNSFAYITTLTSVSLPSTLVEIEMEAFKGATALASLRIPNQVYSIGANAFADTTALTTYSYCGTVTAEELATAGLGAKTKTCAPPVSFDCPVGGGTYQLDSGALIGTTGVCGGDLTLDSSVTAIHTYALGNSALNSLTIPASVTFIMGSPFGGDSAKSLVSITVAESNPNYSSVDGVLFNKLKTELILYPGKKPGATYTIPSTVTSIRYYGFAGNSYLTSINIPDTVTTLGGQTFLYSQALTTVNIGTGLTSVGEQDFSSLPTLTSINVDSTNTSFASIGGVLYDKDITRLLSYPAGKAGSSYVAPSTVTSTAYTVFGGAVNLQTADLSSIIELSGQEFSGSTSIQEVIFGDSLEYLSSQIFQSASNLRKITFGTGITSIEDYVFSGNNRLYCIIYPGSDSYIQNYSYPNGVVPVSSSSGCLANPAITLSASTIVGTVGSPINTYTISSTGGVVATYSISPAISSIPGLSFSTSTGIISGTPTQASVAQTFTVTATNAADTTTRTFTLSVRPKPIPYLISIAKPKMNLKDGAYMCSVGTYEFGYTVGGVVDASVSGLVTPDKYTFTLLINGVADSALTVTTTKEINVWSITQPASGSLISCGVSVTVNSLSTGALSTENTDGVAAAQSVQSAGIKAAEASYKAAAKAIPLAYQKSLVDNRAAWRKVIDEIRANYAVVIDRIKTGGGSKIISDVATASEVTSAAKMKANDDYAASKSAALVTADKATKAATEARALAITKAKATYGTYIESIGHGVLIP